MNHDASIDHEGMEYSAEYSVDGDTLTVFLPDGSTRTTELRGLDAESAAEVHIRAFASKAHNKSN